MTAFFEPANLRPYGIADIDADHAQIIEISNRLFGAMQNKISPEVLGNLLDELLDHCEVHFSREETYLKRMKAENRDLHIADHRNFIRRLKNLKVDFFEKPEVSDSLVALGLLRDYLLHHIKNFDKALDAKTD
jgi:hemerythrin